MPSVYLRLPVVVSACAMLSAGLLMSSTIKAQERFASGSYIGLGLSYGKMSDRLSWQAKAGQEIDRDVEIEDANKSAGVGSLFFGYNWRFNRWLLGLEADITSSLKYRYEAHERDAEDDYDEYIKHKMAWLLTIRPRVGYLISDSLMVYGTAGFASARMKTSIGGTNRDLINPEDSFTFAGHIGNRQVHGWTAGAGLEYAISKRWHLRAEYLYARFQKKSSNLRASTSDGEVVHHRSWIKPKLNQFRLGVSYQF